jgi:hypothetical protein
MFTAAFEEQSASRWDVSWVLALSQAMNLHMGATVSLAMGSEKDPMVLETVMICFFWPWRKRGRKPTVERATPYTLVWISSSNVSMVLDGQGV